MYAFENSHTQLYLELKTRIKSMENVYNKFEVLQSINLMKANDDILQKLISSLTEFYDKFSKDHEAIKR
jgi:hypothetical protein